MKKILIAAGGTGGHVIPAITCADEFKRRGYAVHWLGTTQGIEANLVPKAGIAISYIAVSGVRGKSLLRRLLAPIQIVRSIWQAMRIIMREQPALILGMGGYVAGPAGIAARLLRKPLVIHEQNSIPGVTNQILARLADQVLESFPGSFAKTVAAQCCGNPVRREIAALPHPQQRHIGQHDHFNLLVIGGSLGAQTFNDTLPLVAQQLQAQGIELEIKHQTGKVACETTAASYKAVGVTAVAVVPFIDDMASAYAWADLVVCRAGALTIAEICAAGVAAIFVPYPYAVDDHQTKNAQALVATGAAKLIPQAEFNAVRLSAELKALFAAKQQLLDMACKARALAQSEATVKLVQVCLGFC